MKILSVSIGNTNIRYGIIDDGMQVRQSGIINEKSMEEFAALAYDECFVLSVNSKNAERFKRDFGEMERVRFLQRRKNAFQSDYDMEMLGMDRLVNIFYCIRKGLYPSIIVDAGTADTYDYIDRSGRHRGGFINAGPDTISLALSNGTDLLPEVRAGFGELSLGASTEEAVSRGVFIQWIGGALSAIKLMQSGDPDASLIITGGNGAALKDFEGSEKTVYDESLTLKGIALYGYEEEA